MQDTEETKVSSGIDQPDMAPDDTESHDFTGNEGEVPGKTSDERKDMTNNLRDSRSESLTDLDDFTPVERGAKADSTNYDSKVTTLSSESRNVNSFATLRDNDKENADDKAPDSLTEEETSIDLLASHSKAPSQKKMMFDKIRSTIAHTPQSTTMSPKKPSPVQSPTGKTITKTKVLFRIMTRSYVSRRTDMNISQTDSNKIGTMAYHSMTWHGTSQRPS